MGRGLKALASRVFGTKCATPERTPEDKRPEAPRWSSGFIGPCGLLGDERRGKAAAAARQGGLLYTTERKGRGLGGVVVG